MLNLVSTGQVSKVHILHRDLCFGFDLFKWIFEQNNAQLVIHGEEIQQGTEELADDLLSVVNVFVASKNGRRSAGHRRQRRIQEE